MLCVAEGDYKPYDPKPKVLNMGSSALPPITVPAEDRNRTSPFPYGGHRFEFRAVGSSQNVSLVNTVLATIVANAFKEFADAIEAGQAPSDVAKKALTDSWKTIFNGNGYDIANQEKLTKLGLWRIDSGVDAICRFTVPKNVKLFQDMKVLAPEECVARQTILLEQYIGQVEIETHCMVDMILQHVIPSCKNGNVGFVSELEAAVKTLKGALSDIAGTDDVVEKANKSRTLRLETMASARATCDQAEAVVPAGLWTLATYKDLLFMDSRHV